MSQVCSDIDNAIHSHYKLYPINYIAYDQLTGESRFKDRYTASDMEKVETYIGSQLAKVDDVKDLTSIRYGLHAKNGTDHVCKSFAQ